MPTKVGALDRGKVLTANQYLDKVVVSVCFVIVILGPRTLLAICSFRLMNYECDCSLNSLDGPTCDNSCGIFIRNYECDCSLSCLRGPI